MHMKLLFLSLWVLVSVWSSSIQATIVEFQTSEGSFKVNLHDETTPKTVENFLKYVSEGRYDNTIIHRTVSSFVIQGGGAIFDGQLPPTWIETDSPIVNEPVYSNVQGTISMAKLGGNNDSATSQWFINLKDNSAVLDPRSRGAYSVFGEVIDNGMAIVNKIAAVERCNTGYSGFTEVPMPGFSSLCGNTSAVPGQENFVTVTSVVIYDSTVDTPDTLALVKNTLYDGGNNSPLNSGGGSMSWLGIFMALLWTGRRRVK